MDTKNTRPVFPWYKERLQTKYLKAPTSRISAGSCCLDYFSDGSPVLSGTQRGVSPVIFHGTPSHSQKPRKCISKEHACFSKQMVQKQVRREYVAAVEEKLKQHPLAMYPHYKEHMTPELFDKVVSVLDPDMCVNSASALPTSVGNHAEEENCAEPSKEEVHGAKQATSANKIRLHVRTPTPRNPYTIQMSGNRIKKGQKVKVKDMKAAAKLFSKWFASPDEETNVTDSAVPGRSDSGLQGSLPPTQVENANSFLGQD